jgi:large subunit ribosomal protein L10Ae
LHAEKFGLDSMDVEAIKKMNKNNKLAKKYHNSLASDTIIMPPTLIFYCQ